MRNVDVDVVVYLSHVPKASSCFSCVEGTRDDDGMTEVPEVTHWMLIFEQGPCGGSDDSIIVSEYSTTNASIESCQEEKREAGRKRTWSSYGASEDVEHLPMGREHF